MIETEGTTGTALDPEAVRVGATIRALRQAHGLKITELAAAIGKSRPYLTNIENGIKKAPTEICRKVADTLNVPLAAITVRNYAQIADKQRGAICGDCGYLLTTQGHKAACGRAS